LNPTTLPGEMNGNKQAQEKGRPGASFFDEAEQQRIGSSQDFNMIL
jgi:hypothetical protein